MRWGRAARDGEKWRPVASARCGRAARRTRPATGTSAEETADALTPDGWLRTGDGGYLDEDGYLFLTDRVKDMIISGGENVYPAEVEGAARRIPTSPTSPCSGCPTTRWGEVVAAAVVPARRRR